MPDFISQIPELKMPSGIKKAPTVMPTSTRNLKNQKLGRKKLNHSINYNVQSKIPPTNSLNNILKMQFTCLASRGQPAFIIQELLALYEPILHGGSGVLAAAHTDHDDGEEKEEAGHGEAHSVH